MQSTLSTNQIYSINPLEIQYPDPETIRFPSCLGDNKFIDIHNWAVTLIKHDTHNHAQLIIEKTHELNGHVVKSNMFADFGGHEVCGRLFSGLSTHVKSGQGHVDIDDKGNRQPKYSAKSPTYVRPRAVVEKLIQDIEHEKSDHNLYPTYYDIRGRYGAPAVTHYRVTDPILLRIKNVSKEGFGWFYDQAVYSKNTNCTLTGALVWVVKMRVSNNIVEVIKKASVYKNSVSSINNDLALLDVYVHISDVVETDITHPFRKCVFSDFADRVASHVEVINVLADNCGTWGLEKLINDLGVKVILPGPTETILSEPSDIINRLNRSEEIMNMPIFRLPQPEAILPQAPS